jgi:hypothetical protein
MSYPGQASSDRVVRKNHSEWELRQRPIRRKDRRFFHRYTSDNYAAWELLKRVKALCTSIPSLKSRFARTHLLIYKEIRGLRFPHWQALSPLHHALFWKELDVHLAAPYQSSLPTREFQYTVEIDEFHWPKEFYDMLALLQQRLPKSHCDILKFYRRLSVAWMIDDLTNDLALFRETWIRRHECLAWYQPGGCLSGVTVLRNDIAKMWYNEANGRDLNELRNIIYRHKDLGGAILTAFCNAPRRYFPFAGMEPSLAARTADSATGETVQVASDTIRDKPSDDLWTSKSLNSIGIVESDSEEWDQRRLAHWRQHYGQGRSRTWRYRLYVKATKLQVTALAGKPRPSYLCVTFGPTARLPITVNRSPNTLVTDWKLGKRRRTIKRYHIDEALFSNEAYSSLPRAESNHYE